MALVGSHLEGGAAMAHHGWASFVSAQARLCGDRAQPFLFGGHPGTGEPGFGNGGTSARTIQNPTPAVQGLHRAVNEKEGSSLFFTT